jgi:transcriptional regulator with XRE-family HTH domain
MPVHERRLDRGRSKGRFVIGQTGREFFAARSNAGLSQAAVAGAAGISRSQFGRIERGECPEVPLTSIVAIAAALGLDTSVRFFQIANPVADAAHRALLDAMRNRCHRSLTWRTEVSLPIAGDRRAWDAVISGFVHRAPGTSGRCGVEAETRPNDVQALDRKLALKIRDGDVDAVVLLLADTRHNRAFLRGPGEALRTRFPFDGKRALELLAAGVALPANAIVLL